VALNIRPRFGPKQNGFRIHLASGRTNGASRRLVPPPSNLLPRAIGHALTYDISLDRLDVLPQELTTVLGQAFAIWRGRGNVGIGIVLT
jgi:hypothetical protein